MSTSEEPPVLGIHSVHEWEEHYKKKHVDSGKLVVVDFTASWCGPCRFIAPILVELAKKLPDVVFLKVDVDEVKDLAAEYKVEAMPTFVFLKDGKEIDRLVGAKKAELETKINKHCAEVAIA